MLRNFILATLLLSCMQAVVAQTTCDVVFDLFESDTACVEGASFYLPAVEPFGGVYSGANVSANGYFDVTGLAAGVYEVTYTADTAVCIGSASAFITLVESTPFTLTGNFEVCGADSATIFSPEGYTLTWDDGSKEIIHTFFVDSNYVSTVSYTNEAGCVSTEEFVIYLNDFSRVEVIAPESVCYGQEATIEIMNASIIQWLPYGIYENFITGVFTQDTVLTAKVISNSCDSIYHITLQVADPVLYEIITDTTLCTGQVGLAVAIGNPLSYRLEGFGDFTDSIQFTIGDDQWLNFTATGEYDCTGDTSIFYIMDEYPALAHTAPDSVCEGSTIDVYATGAHSYVWLNNAGGDTLMFGFDQEMQLTAEYSLDWTIEGVSYYGCVVMDTILVYVDATPNVRIDSLTAFCLDKPIGLQAAGAFQYTWSNGVLGSQLEFVGENDTTFSVIGLTYLGCVNYDTLAMVMHEVPVVSAFGENAICEGDTATVSAIGAINYVWEGVLAGTTVYLTPLTDSVVNFVGYTAFGCSDFSNFFIHVDTLPVVEFSGPTFICAGDSSSLEVSSSGTFQWLGGSVDAVIPVDPFNDTTYVVYAVGDNGCPRIDSFHVSVLPYPVLEINGVNELCFGDTIQLNASGAETYTWSMGLSGAEILFVPSGSTTLLVYGSSNGCTSVFPYEMIVHPRPSVAFEFSGDTLCASGTGVSWIANPQGGVLSGDGVVNNWFDLASAINGMNTITYTVVNEFNCSAFASDEIVVQSCLGMDNERTDGIEFYPNPVSSTLTIQMRGENRSYRLWNSQGTCVLSGVMNGQVRIDMQHISSGTYMLEVIGESAHQRQRIVKI